ncbi:MAG: hypothetical protein HYV03_07390 [Deltaproteobacteria bacterium]|nr:hypothetical protein [Deltaproteobacteria bacterium]
METPIPEGEDPALIAETLRTQANILALLERQGQLDENGQQIHAEIEQWLHEVDKLLGSSLPDHMP